MLFGALHGVLLLPVLLSLSDWCCGSKTKKPQVMPPPGMFHPFADGQFTMGVGPPFSKFPRPPVLPYPPLAMGGPAFGAIPLSATAPYAYQQNKNGKLKSKVDQQIMSEAARFAFYRSQFAFLPVGPEVAPYAMGPAFAGMQNPNMLHVQSGKHERNKQFKHAKLVPSNGMKNCMLF